MIKHLTNILKKYNDFKNYYIETNKYYFKYEKIIIFYFKVKELVNNI